MGGDPDETLPPRGSGDGAVAGRTLAIGAQVAGRYRVVRLLGEGGVGEVYAVDDLVLGTSVALKTLRPEHEGSTIALERFRREMAFARKVTNEHVCRLHDVGEHDGRVFLTMELLEGTTLAARLADGGVLALDEIERLAVQLVEGLGALHAAGIVHRDFKPGNVMLVGERAVITDFGLARSMVDRDVALTAESGMLGTPAYMAPEQVEGRAVTPATDVYALGVVLFELVTGTLPFREETALATATARLQRNAPKASALRADVPARWDAILARCLERDPALRPRVDDVLRAVPRRVSRRWFLAAGAGVVTAGSIVGWRLFDRGGNAAHAVVPPVAVGPVGTLVAVLPVEGAGHPVDDPLRLALTMDISDSLAEAGLPKLSLEAHPYFEMLTGSAVILAAPKALPTAWKIAGLRAIVRTTLQKRDATIAVAVTIERRGQPSWSRQLERPAGEVTRLSHDVASVIAIELGRSAPRVPRDAGAHAIEKYIRYGDALGDLFENRHRLDDKPSRTALEELVAAEPTLLRAGGRLALRHVQNAQRSEDPAAIRSFNTQGRAIAERVLAIDPDQPFAVCARGVGAMTMYDWATADRDTARAMELAPTSTRFMQERQYFLAYQGRFDEHDALATRKRALNPLNDDVAMGIGWSLYVAGRWTELAKQGPALLEQIGPEQRKLLQLYVARAYAELDRFDEALALTEQAIDANNPQGAASAVPILVLCGQRDRAVALRARLGDAGGSGIMDDALGNTDAALTWLEKVVNERRLGALFLKIQHFTPALRSQPRFKALMKRVGFA